MVHAFFKRPGMVLLCLCAVALLATLPVRAEASKDVVFAVAATFTTADPWDANDTLSQGMAKSFYEGLVGFDENMKLRYVLATGHTVSEDGLKYTFTLREGVKFHDGTPFNAAAVKANFDRVTNPDNHLRRYGLYANIGKTEVVDDHTVIFHLKEPFSPFVNQLAHPSAGMISPAAMEKYGKDIGFHPVGTGPFIFEEWRGAEFLKVVKNPHYWRPDLPKVDSLTWLPVVENNTRANVIRTGEAHLAFPVPFEQAEVIAREDHLELISAPSIVHRYMSMNTLHKPFDDPRVRQAVNYAIDKDALVKVAFNGYAIPAEGVVPGGVEFSVKLGPWPYDVAKAKELLAEAGYPDGFETILWSAYNHTTAQKILQFLQQQLAQVGIKTTVQALESGQSAALIRGAQDPEKAPVRLYYVGWSSSTGEADWALRPLLYGPAAPPNLFNTAYYDNPKVNEGIEKALVTTDRAEKAKIYKEVQEQIWKDAPWAFLVTEKLLYARNKKLSGAYVMPDASYFFEAMELQD